MIIREKSIMKVLFLDVDGVLNSSQDGFTIKLGTDKHLELLKQIVDKTDAKIVLSSSWRISNKTKSFIENMLKEYGMSIMSSTPDLGSSRGEEIKKWLRETNDFIESFVILDNNSDMGEYTYTKLVKTDRNIGLHETDVIKAIKILNEPIA